MDLPTAIAARAINVTSAISPRLAGRVSLELFRRPIRRARVRPHEAEVHRRARRSSVDVGHAPVVTYQWGDGSRPVLLVHGWQDRASRFAAFVPALEARGFSPVAYDAPGHGESRGRPATIHDHRDIITALHRRHGDFEAVVAHSYGATCAFHALHAGVTAPRVVTINGIGAFGYLPDRFATELALRASTRRHLRREIEQRLFPGETDIWERLSAWYRPEAITSSVLVIHDRDDRRVPRTEADRLVEAYDGRSELVITEGLGHNRTMSDPAVVARTLAHVSSVPAPRG